MSILSWLLQEKRSANNIAVGSSTLAKPSGWMSDMFGGGPKAKSGTKVTEYTALKCSHIYQGVGIRARSLAMLPLKLMKRLKNGGATEALDHPLHKLMSQKPSSEHTHFTWFRLQEHNRVLAGNCYAYKRFNSDLDVYPSAIIPLHPSRCRADRLPDGMLFYWVADIEGKQHPVPAERILHVHGGASLDGITGYSLIELAKESVGLALATEEHGARLFSNGARMSGVLETDSTFSSDEVAERVRKSFEAANTGLENAHRVAILEEGLKFSNVSLTQEEAQFLETRKFQVTDGARWLNLPPHMLGDLEHATYSNIEQQGLEFIKFSLQPEVEQWEEALDAALLTDKDREKYFFSFNMDALARGDMKSRFEAYAIGRQWSIYNADECRALENLGPAPENKGQIYLQPAGFVEAGTLPAEKPAQSGFQNQGEGQKPVEDNPPPAEGKKQAVKRAFKRIFENELTKILTKESNSLRNLVKKAQKSGDFNQFVKEINEFLKDSREFSKKVLTEPLTAYGEAREADVSEEKVRLYVADRIVRLEVAIEDAMNSVSADKAQIVEAVERFAGTLAGTASTEADLLLEVIGSGQD